MTELIQQGMAWLAQARRRGPRHARDWRDGVGRRGPRHARDWRNGVGRRLATGAVIALLCLVGYYVVFAPNGLLAFHQKKTESQRLNDEIQALQQDNARREQQIKALKSEPHAIEKEARERLRYARPGEVVYTMPPAPPAQEKKK